MPATKDAASSVANLRPRIRVMLGDSVAFGPGKADLLTHLDLTRSLNQAAKRMGMSYMKAWRLIQIMNQSFGRPLVKAERGGANGGGAQLTQTGRRVLVLYRQMEAASLVAMGESWDEMRALLAPAAD